MVDQDDVEKWYRNLRGRIMPLEPAHQEYLKTVRCPDCGVQVRESGLIHESGCPVGDGYDKIQNDDREFFEQYPDVNTRRRKPVMAELIDVMLISGVQAPENPYGKAWVPRGFVLVHRTPIPHVRTKDYDNAFLGANPNAGPNDPIQFVYNEPVWRRD